MIRKIVVAALCSAAIAFGQAVGGGGVPGAGGGSGGGGGGSAISITSGPTYSQSDTTIVATWTTAGAANSTAVCGGKSGVDNNIAAPSTFHQAIVVGLTPSTLYACSVTSGSTSSGSTNVTTNAAQTRTAPTSAINGLATINTTPNGDTFYNAVSNDNITYVALDDSSGLTTGCSQNMQINKFTTESTMAGSAVNCFTAFGAGGTSNGTDGTGGHAASNKLNGFFAMGGALYAFASRNVYSSVSGLTTQTAWNGYWMKSNDHGVSWNNFQNPTGFTPTGQQTSPLGATMFPTNLYGWCVPTRYALDDGTNGYLTAGNRIDGADAFVYISCTDGLWNNSSNLYLARIPRIQFAAQNYGALQYWTGPAPASATPTAFVADSNWSSSSTSATAIYSAANQTSSQDMVFVPTLNIYLLLTWYQPNPAVTSNSTWVISSGATPAGPWTTLLTQVNNPSGFYNPVVQHRTVATNVLSSAINLQLLYSGDYNNQATYYHPTYSTLTLNPAPLLDSVNAGTATFAGSFSHLLRTAYGGNAIQIERASDSTLTNVGFNANGTVNQSTISTFCSGTTCNVMTLYDQSGSNHNATQATFANGCVIYTSGAVVTNGVSGQVACKWDNTQRFLTSIFTFSGTLFESVGVGTLGATGSGAGGFAGMVTMGDGTHSGGSFAGLANVANEAGSAQAVSAFIGGTGGTAPNQAITYGTQFAYNSTFNYTAGSEGLGVNGAALTTATGTGTSLTATQLVIGADFPTNTYFWNGFISDVVLYSATLTGAQRATAHAVESAFFGTP